MRDASGPHERGSGRGPTPRRMAAMPMRSRLCIYGVPALTAGLVVAACGTPEHVQATVTGLHLPDGVTDTDARGFAPTGLDDLSGMVRVTPSGPHGFYGASWEPCSVA